MLKRYLCVIFTLLTCVLGFPSFSVSAAEDDDTWVKKNFDAICLNYGLSGNLGSIDETFYYIYGRENGGSGNPVSVLWIGSRWYRCKWNESDSIPSFSYYTGTGSLTGNAYRVGYGSAALFWYSPDSTQIQFISGFTDALTIFNQYEEYHSGWNFSMSETFEDFGSSLGGSSDPTEPTAPGGFELPDSWLNGGETLPAVDDPTFPASFSPDEAFGYIEDYTVELDEGTKSGIGFFWAVLSGVIGALGIWDYVFFSLLMGLLAWVLRGVF